MTILDTMEEVAEWIDPSPPRISLLRDPDDAVFMDLAIAGQADYLITANLKHYPKLSWIVKARQFLETH